MSYEYDSARELWVNPCNPNDFIFTREMVMRMGGTALEGLRRLTLHDKTPPSRDTTAKVLDLGVAAMQLGVESQADLERMVRFYHLNRYRTDAALHEVQQALGAIRQAEHLLRGLDG